MNVNFFSENFTSRNLQQPLTCKAYKYASKSPRKYNEKHPECEIKVVLIYSADGFSPVCFRATELFLLFEIFILYSYI